MGSPLEIERKFVIHPVTPGHLLGYPAGTIRQGYITTGDSEIRIRTSTANGGACKLAIKTGDGLVRHELEAPVADTVTANLLFLLAQGREVRKTRYKLGRWEIDQFHGQLEGLWLAEIELESEDEPTPPFPVAVTPKFEVTLDPRYKNQSLALNGLEGFPNG